MEIVFKLYYSTNNRWEKDRFRYWIERIRPLRFYTLFFSFLFFRQRTRKIDYLAGGWWWFRCEDVKLKGDGNCEFKLYYSSNNRWEKDRFRYWMGRSSIGEEFWQDRRISWRTGEVILLVPLLRISWKISGKYSHLSWEQTSIGIKLFRFEEDRSNAFPCLLKLINKKLAEMILKLNR